MLKIVDDAAEPLRLRESAMGALCRIADESFTPQLRHLAFTDANSDPNDEIRGCALRTIWPGYLDAKELFGRLEMPRRPSLIGMYHLFLIHDLVRGLAEKDLPIALTWVRERGSYHKLPDTCQSLADAIAYRAWQAFDSEAAQDEFVALTTDRLLAYEDIIHDPDLRKAFLEGFRQDGAKRHRLVEGVAKLLLSKPQENSATLLAQLISSTDMAWMIERFESAQTEEERSLWADSLQFCLNPDDQACAEALYYGCERNPGLAQLYADRFAPVTLGSEEAKRQKAWHARRNRPCPDTISDHPIAADISPIISQLNRLDDGKLDGWYYLNRLMVRSMSSSTIGEFQDDLTAVPRWNTLDESTQGRIITAAGRYILEFQPRLCNWIGTDHYPLASMDGYRAFRLLLKQSSAFLDQLPKTVWQRWSATIVAFTAQRQIEVSRARLVGLAYGEAPDQVIEAFLQVIDVDNRSQGDTYNTPVVSECWDERLGEALLIKIMDSTLTIPSKRTLLQELLARRVKGARDLAESWIRDDSSSMSQDLGVAAALALAWSRQPKAWDFLFDRIRHDSEFGREFIGQVAVAYDSANRAVLDSVNEDTLGLLYAWLIREFPPEEDPHIEETHTPTVREEIGYFRNRVLSQLMRRGTLCALEALQRLCHEFPTHTYLIEVLSEAREATLRARWSPAEPYEVMSLVQCPDRRLINSGRQLLDLILESLQRLQDDLQGETPAVVDLWDERGGGSCRPKDEGRFSDYVKRHLTKDLQNRGVVANREVEVRRGTTQHPGERTDIYVNAVAQAGHRSPNIVTAIIETKGCWNSAVKSAMQSQLVDRYLRDNDCRHGLYLVGWFSCDEWDRNDRRKGHTPQWSLREARKFFDEQARVLSAGDQDIRACVMNLAMR